MARGDHARAGLNIRCAIYTRKSSDEGLEQEFNSLDAQREGCEAYIVSQRHAGWVALANMYDDGGLSCGTMEWPSHLTVRTILCCPHPMTPSRALVFVCVEIRPTCPPGRGGGEKYGHMPPVHAHESDRAIPRMRRGVSQSLS